MIRRPRQPLAEDYSWVGEKRGVRKDILPFFVFLFSVVVKIYQKFKICRIIELWEYRLIEPSPFGLCCRCYPKDPLFLFDYELE